MYPLFLDLTGRLAVVIGGGPVGRRKAVALREAGARVRMVCREPRPSEWQDDGVEWIEALYAPAHLNGAILVIAAGPAEVNDRVVTDARARGILVNSASGPSGDFDVPAVVRRGDLLVAVGTGGAAPALAQALRQRLEAELDDAFAVWVRLLGEMRELVRERGDEEWRRAFMRRLCDWKWLERLRNEGEEAVRAAMRATSEPEA
jgi:siroheme synthase-like protein